MKECANEEKFPFTQNLVISVAEKSHFFKIVFAN